MKPSCLPSGWFCFFVLFCCFSVIAKAEVSTTPPANYEKSIRPLLSSLVEIKAKPDVSAGKNEPGRIALLETITRVEEDGTYLRAFHYIYQPYTQKGAEDLSTDRYRFYSRSEKVHVALARTVLPDGTEKPLDQNAIFTQKGERSSGSIYDDGQDLVLVFPDVKPGAWCEAIVVYECTEPRVKGGYGEAANWIAGWTTNLKRQVVDLPKSWADRIQTARIGKSAPEVTRADAAPDRIRLEWKKDNIPRSTYETSEAPADQVGPATWMTTFSSWDEFANWYQGLLGQRGDLDDDLRKKVDEWTADSKNPRETIDRLYDHVANDVRYEGLEFGLSALQPYSCGTVWKNQYGDCKDKANLLVAMLRYKGIKAYLVLVNTEHAGLVLKEIPDHRHFNHAIAMAELPSADGKTERIFCDATIQHGRAGLLWPSAANRDVLAIQDGKALWLRTPSVQAGEESYQFDMNLNEEGRLSGWMTLKSTGCYAVNVTDIYAGVDRETARERLRMMVSSFITGAEVVDFVLPTVQRTANETVLKVYFSSPARQRDSEGRLSIPFVSSPRLFNDFGDGKERRTSYFMWADRTNVTAAIKIPAGWVQAGVPQPLKLETPFYKARSEWKQEGNVWHSNLTLEATTSLIPAASVAVVAQANRSMSSWLAVPLFIKPGSGEAAAKPQTDVAVDMDLMPTGEGQMDLVNRIFPREGSSEKRRAALEKVITFFPDDTATVFEARVELAYQIYKARDNEKAGTAFDQLTKRRPEGVTSELFSFAEHLYALTLRAGNKKGEAVAIWRRLADDATLSPYRRGWSAYMAGSSLASERPVQKDAIPFLTKALEIKEGECSEDALVELIPVMIATGEGQALATLLATHPDIGTLEKGGADALEKVVAALKTSTESPTVADALPWLTSARDQATDESRKKMLADVCIALESWASRGDAYAACRAALNKAIAENGKRYLDGKDPGETSAAVETKLESLYGRDREAWMRLAAGYFLKFEPSAEFSKIVWQFHWYAANGDIDDRKDPDRSLFGKILSSGDPTPTSLFMSTDAATTLLPESDSNYTECRIVTARALTNQGKAKQSLEIYQKLRSSPTPDSDFGFAISYGTGMAYEMLGQWKEATGYYLEYAQDRYRFKGVPAALMKAGLLQARMGQRQQALDTWQMLADVPPANYAESPLQLEISNAIALAKDPSSTLEMWKKMDDWWKKRFIPYYRALGQTGPGEAMFYYQEQGEALDLQCAAAVADGNKAVIAKYLAGVATSARWMPSNIAILNSVHATYVQPLWKRPLPYQEMLRDAAAIMNKGTPLVRDFNLRLHAAYALDTNEPETALALMKDQFQPESDHTEDHRERCAYIYCAAAALAGKELENALSVFDDQLKAGFSHISAGKWAVVRADLLSKSGKSAEAKAYLTAQLNLPTIRNSPEATVTIEMKLASFSKPEPLQESSNVGFYAQKFMLRYKPAWYDQVGPKDLQDPRVGDVATVLDGDLAAFEPCEKYRLRMLIALSGDLPMDLREKAFTDAVMDSSKWQRTWKDAYGVWSYVLDDTVVSTSVKVDLLWKAANSAAGAGQSDILSSLKAKKIFKDSGEIYQNSYFPLLESYATALTKGPADLKACLLKLGEGTVDEKQLNLASDIHAALLAAEDQEAAAEVRNAMKSWKFEPKALAKANDIRLLCARQAGTAKEGISVSKLMREAFGTTLIEVAKKAPAGWQQRVDLSNLTDLSREEANGIRASIMLTGFGRTINPLHQWFQDPSFWFGEKRHGDPASFAKVIVIVKELKNDFMLASLLDRLTGWLEPAPENGWAKVDEVLDANFTAGQRPLVTATIRQWRFYRNLKPGMAIPTQRLLDECKQLGQARNSGLQQLLEVLVVAEDVSGLEAVLNEIDPNLITDPGGIECYMDALRIVGREEELEVVADKAERILKVEMTKAWLDKSSIYRTCDLAISCKLETSLPDQWRKDMCKETHDRSALGLNRAYIAYLAGDWNGMIKLLNESDKPTTTDKEWHWLMGRALVGLGKPDLARPHLEVVVQDGPWHVRTYLPAGRLLKSL